MDRLIEDVPPSLMAEWNAFYMLRPWDAAATYALMKGQFDRPDWLEDLVEQETKKLGRRRRRSQTKASILRAARGKTKTHMGWTWP